MSNKPSLSKSHYLDPQALTSDIRMTQQGQRPDHLRKAFMWNPDCALGRPKA
jgi:hypothetical protein